MERWDTGWEREDIKWATLAAVVFMLMASVVAAPFIAVSDSTYTALGVSALVSAGLIGGTCWLLLERFALGHFFVGGAIAGGTTGLLAHPLMWVLAVLPTGNIGLSLGSSILSLYSLVFFGWLTLPLGILGGLLVGALRVHDPNLFSR